MSATRETKDEPRTSEAVKKPRSLWDALVIALFLIFIPALYGGMAGWLYAVPVILWGLVSVSVSFWPEFKQVRVQRLRNRAIYLSAAILALSVQFCWLSNAKSRGEALVFAIKSFRADNQTYPQHLAQLVPKYIDRVPAAAFGPFSYYFNPEHVGEGPMFSYVVDLGFFLSRGYCFEGKCMTIPKDGSEYGSKAEDGWNAEGGWYTHES